MSAPNWNEDSYTGFGDEEVRVDAEDTGFDEDGLPVLTRLTYTDVTGSIESQDLEAFANGDADIDEGWVIRSSGWSEDGKTFVIEVADSRVMDEGIEQARIKGNWDGVRDPFKQFFRATVVQ